MNVEVIKEIKSLEFHDWPVTRLEILFVQKEIILEVEEVREDKYYPIIVKFKDIVNLYTNNPESTNFQCEDIYHLDIKGITHEIAEAHIIFGMGPNNPVFVVNILFREIELIKSDKEIVSDL